MSIADLITGWRGTGSRRAIDEVRRLREEVFQLRGFLQQAGDELALLQWDLTVANSHLGKAELLVVHLDADIEDLTKERDALQEEVTSLRQRFAAQLAAEANAAAIRVPPVYRDTSDPDDQATEPIRVLTLAEAFGSTDPTHVPAWALKTGPAA
ncbi:hypothetical protein C9F11_37935 [Streptomyces sp. YIM 121038]|uniref:hypothetical protein n=1 Tax=Streptomyces sp. YIM 121038 TaxID=2136401 RepID=UPI001163CBC5|nr:hypothetical protein [Streptomyces sp. YIM 121038]QCX81170.1 hypothetical protein C9F11_37935 [Streptomyces sp. YIM 121038]